jgi:hypothetical protein
MPRSEIRSHPYEDDGYGTCRTCGFQVAFGLLHPEPAVELSDDYPVEVLPEDTVPWRSIPCPRCASTGPCVGDYGWVPPHRERLAKALEEAS